MASVNKVIILGNLGRDPEIRALSNGESVANLAVATTENWKDKDGNRQEKTEWHRVILYKRLAEIAGEYLAKGSQVYIEGRLETKKWTDKEGVEKFTTEIIGNELKMLGSPAGAATTDKSSATAATRQQQPQSKQAPRPAARHDPVDDDIPF